MNRTNMLLQLATNSKDTFLILVKTRLCIGNVFFEVFCNYRYGLLFSVYGLSTSGDFISEVIKGCCKVTVVTLMTKMGLGRDTNGILDVNKLLFDVGDGETI